MKQRTWWLLVKYSYPNRRDGTVKSLSDSDVLTIKEVAEQYRLSTKSIYRLVQQKRIPHFRVGGSIRFFRKALEEYDKGEFYL